MPMLLEKKQTQVYADIIARNPEKNGNYRQCINAHLSLGHDGIETSENYPKLHTTRSEEPIPPKLAYNEELISPYPLPLPPRPKHNKKHTSICEGSMLCI
jgi:hypothetical protein